MQFKIKDYMNKIIIVMMALCLCGCTAESSSAIKNEKEPVTINSIKVENLSVEYAKGFTMDLYDDSYYVINIKDQQIVMIPEEADIPEWVNQDMIVLKQPLKNLYIAASSIPDMIDCLGQMNRISYTSTTYEDWAIDSMKGALEVGDVTYVGKYRSPDYEILLANGCDLAIESTMIYHNPEVFEKLEQIKIPVMVDYSSYENDPLGRMEWMKVYGALLGCYDESVKVFEENKKVMKALEIKKTEPKTVAFFYINSNGSVVVRKPGDYVTKMIEMAGGEYVIHSIPEEENALSTMNMQMEAFYREAVDADILIYNSTIDGEIQTMSELIGKSELMKDFKAVKEKKVWCTGKNMYQETSAMAEMIQDFHKVINGDSGNAELTYLHALQDE